jgi:hypothetical protein
MLLYGYYKTFFMANKKATRSPRKMKNEVADERTAKKIHEHLINEEDKISDEDISLIKTDFTDNPEIVIEDSSKPANGSQAEKTAEETPENEKSKDNTDPGVESAWNILEE